MVNRRFYHKIIIIILILSIFTTSCFASSTANVIDAMKNLSTVDELYNYIKTTFGSDGSNVTNTFLNAILQTLKNQLSTSHNIVWVDFATKNVMGVSGDFRDYMYRDSNTQASTYVKLRDFYDRYYTYSDGNAALLNQINTNTTNMYGSQSATNVQLSNLNDKYKNLLSNSILVYDSNDNGMSSYYTDNGTLSLSNNNRTVSVTVNNNRGSYIGFTPPVYTYDSYVVSYDLTVSDNSNVRIMYQWNGQDGYLVRAGYTYKMVHTIYNDTTSVSPALAIQLYNYDSSLTYTISNIKIMAVPEYEKFNQIVNAINNKQLEAYVDVSINNTITDNDLTLDVDLPDNATNDTSNLLNKLKQLMLTGITTNQLLNALDDVELNAWYSQSNKDVVEALNNQYISLYD